MLLLIFNVLPNIFPCSDARDAIRGRDGYELDGCRIRVEMTRGVGPRGPGGRPLYGPDRGERDRRPPPPRGPPRRSGYRVLVTGLPVTGSWQDLKVGFCT